MNPEPLRKNPAALSTTRRIALWAGPAIVFGVLICVAFSERLIFHLGPLCYLNRLTGLYCPGCGGTRGFFALVHGDVMKSIRYNPWTLILLSGLTLWGIKRIIRAFAPDSPWGRPLPTPAWSLWALLAIVLIYGILRNLPWWPFTLLAPHG